MAASQTIPSIAITLNDDTESNASQFSQSLANALTDVEDMGSEDGESTSPEHVPLLSAGVGNEGTALTDSEYVEGSDEDDEYRPRTPTPLDNLLEFEGTFEELLQVTSDHKGRGVQKMKSSSKQTTAGLLGLPDDGRDALTDYEDFALSDDDWVEEDMEFDDVDLDTHMPDDGTVDIADRIRRPDASPSPSVTPEPGQVSSMHDGSFSPHVFAQPSTKCITANRKSSSKKKSKPNFLSPKPETREARNDVTDTEILPSDSDEETPEKLLVRRQKKTTLQVMKPHEEGATDVEDLELSGDEAYKTYRKVPKNGRSSKYYQPEEDTDSEDMKLSDREEANPLPPRRVKYSAKAVTSGGLSVPAVDAGALTDTEDVDGIDDSSEDEERPPSPLSKPLKDMEAHYGSVTVSYQTKERAQEDNSNRKFDDNVSEQEAFTTEESSDDPLKAQKHRRAMMKYLKRKTRWASTDEDDMEASDGDFKHGDRGDNIQVPQDVFEIRFMDVEGEARPVIVAPKAKLPSKSKGSGMLEILAAEGGLTDVEEVHTSASSGDEEETKQSRNMLNLIPTRRGSHTDVEDFEENIEEEDLPEHLSDSDVENALPESIRELTLIQIQQDGPVAITLPLPENHPLGLISSNNEAENLFTDVEDISGDEKDTIPIEEPNRGPTPDLPEMDFGNVEASEAIKVHKKKLKLPGTSHLPLTDTEDVYVDGEPSRRKRRPKTKLLQPKAPERDGATDVEELVVSDAEVLAKDGIAVVTRRRSTNLYLPQGISDSATDVEDMNASEEGADSPKPIRAMSVTPDIMRNMDYSTTTFKEGSGILNRERRHTSEPSVPTIRMISPSPDIQPTEHTDTEDMQASADEDAVMYSRAETATPMQYGLDIEEHASSVVHVKHTRKLDYEAAEEAIHMKVGYNIREAHTDVEELGSEDEPRLGDRISVNDTNEKVCVCFSGEKAYDDSVVCVCVGKPQGDLSMVWKTGNATSPPHCSSDGSPGQEWTGKAQDAEPEQSGTDGALMQGAAGSSSQTTTETRVVEGSEDTTMQELLDKLAAEQRK